MVRSPVRKPRIALWKFSSGFLLSATALAAHAETQISGLSFGGELREMVEVYENDSFSPVPDADSTAFLQRYLLHADWRPAARLRFFGELQSAFENGRPGDGDRNALDLHQLFADVVIPIGPHTCGSSDGTAITDSPGNVGKSVVKTARTTTAAATTAGGQGDGGTLTFRIGRQELSYGSQRLIGVRDGTNNRRAFDAIRLIWQSGREASSVTANPGGGNNNSNNHHNNRGGGSNPIRIDLFAGRPVEWDQGVFDDQTIDGTTLGGLYATFPLTSLTGLNLDLYWLALDRDEATFSQGTAHEKRQTIGTRFFGKTGAWDFNHEAMLQWGRFGGGGGSGGGGDILAWSVATDHGFTLQELPGKPRLGLKAAIASGDRDAGDRDLQTFNPLYPRGSYFTEA